MIRFTLPRLSVLFLTLLMGNAWAQCKGDFGADKAATEVRLALYGDAYKSQKFQEARAPLSWLLKNAPKVSTKIYVDGVDIFDKLATAETDPVKKQGLIDSMMVVYDLRIQNCGDEAQVVNRKANSYFKFYYKQKEKLGEVLAMFDKTYELNGEKMMESSLDLYMKTVQLHSSFNKGSMTEDQILERYDRISAIIDTKSQKAVEAGKAADVEKLKTIRTNVDDNLAKSPVKFTCDMVKAKLEPKFRANPTDKNLAKKIFNFMLQDKCTDDPLWLETGEVIKDIEPKDFGLINNLAKKHLSNGNTEKAEILIKEALAIAVKPEQKGDALLTLGALESKKGNNGGARDYFYQSVQADPANKDGYNKIGDLYYNSFNDCAKRQNMAEDRLIYIAAFEMYSRACGDCKAGATDPVKRAAAAGMLKSKAQFPSKEEIFLLNWKAGESKSVKCWFSEAVTLKTRD